MLNGHHTNLSYDKITLVGMMGTGKSKFGRLIANNLNFNFYDIDSLIEKKFKRVRKKKNEPRFIDLDLLAYNNQIINSRSLILPHPRMHLRKFVMKPICDIDKEWIHPLLQEKARKIIKELANQKISNIKLEHGKSHH